MYKHKNYREVLREIIEMVPEEKLGEASRRDRRFAGI